MAKTLNPVLGMLAVLIWGASLHAGEAAPAAAGQDEARTSVIVPAGTTEDYPGADSRTSVDFRGDTLKTVLEFLSTRSNLNIRTLDDAILDLRVTFKLDNVSWREILNFLAEKYGLIVDD